MSCFYTDANVRLLLSLYLNKIKLFFFFLEIFQAYFSVMFYKDRLKIKLQCSNSIICVRIAYSQRCVNHKQFISKMRTPI